ncbi:glycoside hydrolase family 76 protein, partial [Suhomyces tanzawaensis NRRL Y-17324]
FSASAAFSGSINTLWGTFWSDSESSFSDGALHCLNSTFDSPSIWDLAVTGRAITASSDDAGITKVINNCLEYKNSEGWFSLTTAKDQDIYVDDNAQVLWVFLDAYKKTGNHDHLQIAQSLFQLIKAQWVQKSGGVRWKLGAPYVASISTLEAALAAARLFQITGDVELIGFAKQCTDWVFKTLVDEKDGLIFDGLNSDTGEINKGKLSYTVGVMLSTLSIINKSTASASILKQAVQLAQSALNTKGVFYNADGYWNNRLSYSHLFFGGLVDLL